VKIQHVQALIYLFLFFIISIFVPFLGYIFSFFIAGLCFLTPLARNFQCLYITLAVLFVSNVADPSFTNPSLNFVNPFHFGVLAIVTPTQIFCIGAIIKFCLNVILRYPKISFLNIVYLALLLLSLTTSYFGFEENNERKFQTLSFFFNISAYVWFYEYSLKMSNNEVTKLISLLKFFGILYFFFVLFEFNLTHIKFLFFSMYIMIIYVCFKSGKWYWYLVIPFVVFSGMHGGSLTVKAIMMLSLLLCILSMSNKKLSSIYVRLILLTVVSVQVLIFLVPLFSLPQECYVYSPHDYENVDHLLDRILFKLCLDRAPLWLGAIEVIKDNYFISSSGTGFIPGNWGAFQIPSRQIHWIAGAHQTQLELMLNYGVLGAFFYWALWVSFLKRLSLAVSAESIFVKFFAVSLLAYFISSSFVSTIMINEHGFAAWVLMGITIGQFQKSRFFQD